MAIAGNTTTPNSHFNFSGSNTLNENASPITMPENGSIYQLHVFFAGDSANPVARLVVWDNSGNVIAYSPQFTAPSGGHSVGGQSWNAYGLEFPSNGILQALSGATLWVGFWRQVNSSSVFSVFSSGSFSGTTALSGNLETLNESNPWGSNGQMGVYVDYNPSGGHIFDGSAFQASLSLQAYDGGTWRPSLATKIFDGSSWQNAI